MSTKWVNENVNFKSIVYYVELKSDIQQNIPSLLPNN